MKHLQLAKVTFANCIHISEMDPRPLTKLCKCSWLMWNLSWCFCHTQFEEHFPLDYLWKCHHCEPIFKVNLHLGVCLSVCSRVCMIVFVFVYWKNVFVQIKSICSHTVTTAICDIICVWLSIKCVTLNVCISSQYYRNSSRSRPLLCHPWLAH